MTRSLRTLLSNSKYLIGMRADEAKPNNNDANRVDVILHTPALFDKY